MFAKKTKPQGNFLSAHRADKSAKEIQPNFTASPTNSKKEDLTGLSWAYKALDEFIIAEDAFVTFLSNFLHEKVQSIIEAILPNGDAKKYNELIAKVKDFLVFNNVFFLLLADANTNKGDITNTSDKNFSQRIKIIHKIVCDSEAFSNMAKTIIPIKKMQFRSNLFIAGLKNKINGLTFQAVIKDFKSPKSVLSIVQPKLDIAISWENFSDQFPTLIKDTIISHITNSFIICIQRIQRYQLPLKEIVKQLPDSHPDTEKLHDILKKIDQLVILLDRKLEENQRSRLFVKSNTEFLKDPKQVINNQLILELAHGLIIYPFVLPNKYISSKSIMPLLTDFDVKYKQEELPFLFDYLNKIINIYLTSPGSAFEKIALAKKTFLTRSPVFTTAIQMTTTIHMTTLYGEKLSLQQLDLRVEEVEKAEDFIQKIFIYRLFEEFSALQNMITSKQVQYSTKKTNFFISQSTISYKYNKLDELIISNINSSLLKLLNLTFKERANRIQNRCEKANIAALVVDIIKTELQPLGLELPISKELNSSICTILMNALEISKSEIIEEFNVRKPFNFQKTEIANTEKLVNTYGGHFLICKFLNLLLENQIGIATARAIDLTARELKMIKQIFKIDNAAAKQIIVEILHIFFSHGKSTNRLISLFENLNVEARTLFLKLLSTDFKSVSNYPKEIPLKFFECNLCDNDLLNYFQLTIMQFAYEPFHYFLSKMNCHYFFNANEYKLYFLSDITSIFNRFYNKSFSERQNHISTTSHNGTICDLLSRHIELVLENYRHNTDILRSDLKRIIDSSVYFLKTIPENSSHSVPSEPTNGL